MSALRRLPIRVRETRLGNGLQVLACERRGHPVVCCMVWYRVGSRDERDGRTGIAHFLEHLTFKGTRRFGKGTIDAITSRLGGTNNAFTDADCTAYYFAFASDRWEAALAVEAERMRSCRFDPPEVEAERRVVLEEMRMSQDDPWRDLFEEAAAAAFLIHPYRRPVIGREADLRAASVEQISAFYRRHYRPENATLVLVGDFDAGEALARARRAFERVRVGNGEAPDRIPREERPRGERRVSIARPDAVARLLVGHRACRFGDPEETALDAAGVILASGKSSRLYRRLVLGNAVATAAYADNDARLDPGVFWVSVEVRRGVSVERAERALLAEVERFARAGPTGPEVRRAKRILEAATAFELEGVSEIAEDLGRHAMRGDWRGIRRHLPAVARLTPRAVRAAARRTFRPWNRTVAVSRPLGRGNGFGDGLPAPAPLPTPAPPPRRRSPPAPVPARFLPAWRTAPVVRFASTRVAFENGLVLAVTSNDAAPTVTAAAFVEAGLAFEPPRLGGVAHLAGALLDEGTRRRTGREITDAVESVGGSLDAGLGGMSVSVPAREAPLAFDLLAEMLREPSYPAPAFERRRALLVAELEAEADDPRTRAYQRLRREVYGRHPLRRPGRGTPESVRRIRRADLVDFHRRAFGPGRTIAAVAGQVEVGEVIERLGRRLGAWRASPQPLPAPAPPAPPGRGREILLREPRAQVQAFLGHLGVRRSDPDFYALLVLDQVLGSGSGFTDRLSRRLRDERGLAYAVHADFASSAGKEPGLFVATIGTAPETFRLAVAELRAEIGRILRDPPTAEELRAAKDYLVGSFPFGLERNAGRALYLIQRERFGLGEDYLDRYPALVEGVTRRAVVAAARRHIVPAGLVLVASGRVGP